MDSTVGISWGTPNFFWVWVDCGLSHMAPERVYHGPSIWNVPRARDAERKGKHRGINRLKQPTTPNTQREKRVKHSPSPTGSLNTDVRIVQPSSAQQNPRAL